MTGRHQSQFAWAASSFLSFLLAVMVMHQMVPQYSREKTIFGAGSPLPAEFANAHRIPIATVAHEFSEVPFYRNQNDIQHFDLRSSGDLGAFVDEHGEALIVLHQRVLLGELRQQLPDGYRIQLIGHRGPANLLYISAPDAQLAVRPEQAYENQRIE